MIISKYKKREGYKWLNFYNYERNNQGEMCCGRTSIETSEDGKRFGRKNS